MTYLIKFIIGILIFLSSVFVHELGHWIPAKIMGLNPKFEMKGWAFRVETHNLTRNKALITGLIPIPFVAICIFISLLLIVDYTSIVNNRLLCLIFMIVLSIVSSVMISISDLKVLYAIIH